MKRTSTILIAAVLSLTATAQNRFEAAAKKADSIICQTKEYKDMLYKIFETLNKYAIELSPKCHATPLADYLIENKISVPEVRLYYKMDQAKIIVWTSRKDKQKIVMELKQLTEMFIEVNNIERESNNE